MIADALENNRRKMPITTAQLREVLQSPKHAALVREASEHESRIRLHSEPALSRARCSGALTEFLNWVEGLLPRDKFKLFVHLFRFPVKTVETTENIYEALEKVFDARNAAFHYEFVTEGAAQDWKEYRQETLGWPGFWRGEAFGRMKAAINSLLVVDLPASQGASPLPEPYAYFLDVSHIIDFEMQGLSLSWVIFKQPGGRVAVLDDTSWRVYATGETMDFSRWALEKEATHNLGYCPAQWFWHDPAGYQRPALKRSPLSSQLDNLDWLLFFSISKRMQDTYAPWPIYWSYEQDCDYHHPESGEYCEGGFLRAADNNYILTRSGDVMECPRCSHRRLTGPGSVIDVPVPGPSTGDKDLRNPAGVIPADIQSLEFVVAEITRLKGEITRNVTGYPGDPINNQAINESQVAAFYEAYTQALRNLKKNFEKAQKWAAETICRLRYGDDFVSASVSYGTEFYIYTSDDAYERYQAARENGADGATLDNLLRAYHETRHRENPEQARRAEVLSNLDPFRHLSLAQVQDMYRTGEIGYEEYMVKANFSSLIMRFERENINVLQFGALLPFSAKIQRIQEILLSYATQFKPEGREPAAGSASGNGEGSPGTGAGGS